MFGRRTAEAIEFELPPEREQELVKAALERVEAVDGADFLDGYKLPPGNEEIFGGPRTYRIPVTYMYHRENPDGQEEWAAKQETHMVEQTLTNRDAREANTRCIALYGRPLFIGWEDVGLQEAVRHETIWAKFRNSVSKLVEKTVA